MNLDRIRKLYMIYRFRIREFQKAKFYSTWKIGNLEYIKFLSDFLCLIYADLFLKFNHEFIIRIYFSDI